MSEDKKNPVIFKTINTEDQACCESGTNSASDIICGSRKEKTPLTIHPMEQHFVIDSIQTQAGPIPKVSSTLEWSDRLGNIKARWGVGRMEYKVVPGLYGLGNPDENSHIFVTANYKMSFDRVREALPDRNAWILVLDTDGVNVWCAAGKGTFGTDELVSRLELSGLSSIVSHRELILPQLGAPGVSAHKVKKLSGFKVIYGPILSKDLPAFLDAGLKATPEMRRKTFTIRERITLIPVELVYAFKWAVLISLVFFLLGGLGGPGWFLDNALDFGLFAVLAIFVALFAGTILTPLLLPWLPGRAFALKGLFAGLIGSGILTLFRTEHVATMAGRLEILAWFLLISALSAYLAMNFTGSSTYTSLSGVRKEMKYAVPMEIATGVLGLCLWIGSRFIS